MSLQECVRIVEGDINRLNCVLVRSKTRIAIKDFCITMFVNRAKSISALAVYFKENIFKENCVLSE